MWLFIMWNVGNRNFYFTCTFLLCGLLSQTLQIIIRFINNKKIIYFFKSLKNFTALRKLDVGEVSGLSLVSSGDKNLLASFFVWNFILSIEKKTLNRIDTYKIQQVDKNIWTLQGLFASVSSDLSVVSSCFSFSLVL